MATMNYYPVDRTKPESTKLKEFRENITSQCGEDGIISRIFSLMKPTNEWCVEFGAHNGKTFSNTWSLINNNGWRAVLIEGNPPTYEKLVENYSQNDRVVTLNSYVGIRSEHDSLDSLLSRVSVPNQFDFLSIDIDGCDWHVWNSLAEFRPRLILIEFNPTIPNNVSFVQNADPTIHQGSSLRAMIELGKEKQYELIATTKWNAFFVVEEEFHLFDIEDNSIDAIHDNSEFETIFFQLFDGTVKIAGCKRLLWHNLKFTDEDVQILPPSERVYGVPRKPASGSEDDRSSPGE